MGRTRSTAWARVAKVTTSTHMVREGAVIAAVVTLANVSAYGLNVVAARRLGPAEFGALASLLGLIVIGYVASTSVQTVTTRRVVQARLAGRPPESGRLALTAGVASILMGIVAVAAARPLQAFLHLPSPAPVALLAATLVPLTWIGYVLGLAQGKEDFGLLAVLLLLTSSGRLGGAIAGVLIAPTLTGVTAFMAAGTSLSAVAATFMVRSGVGRPRRPSVGARETAHAVHSMLAFLVLSNLDLLLARHFLRADQAGTYGVGSVITKVAFWLPQFVVVLALPRMSDLARRESTLRISVVLIAASGAFVTLGVAATGGLAVLLVGGHGYSGLDGYAWMFALLGSCFSLAQLLLFGRLARRDRWAVLGLWAAVGVESLVVAWRAHGSPVDVVTAALATTGLLVLFALAFERAQQRTGSVRPPLV